MMIKNLLVYLDDNQLEFMDGAVRCGCLVAENDEGEETMLQNVIDSSGFSSVKELVDELLGIFNLHRSDILVVG